MASCTHDLNNAKLVSRSSRDPIPSTGATHEVEVEHTGSQCLWGTSAAIRVLPANPSSPDLHVKSVDGSIQLSTSRTIGHVDATRVGRVSVDLARRNAHRQVSEGVRTIVTWYKTADDLLTGAAPASEDRRCEYRVVVS